MKMVKKTIATLGIFLILSCANITINVYFTPESIQEAADVIEEKVRGKVLEEEVSEPKQTSWAFPGEFIRDLFCTTAYAAEPNLKIDTPEIQKIVDSRATRFPEIDKLLTEGVVGEGNDGYLKERDLRQLGDLKKVAAARKLLKEENSDRENLYKAIAKENDLTEDKVAEIGANFAISIRDDLREGQYFQNDKGAWEQKRAKKKD